MIDLSKLPEMMRKPIIDGIQKPIQDAPAGQKYAALKTQLTNVGQTELVEKLDRAGSGIQNALAHAVSNNDNFVTYLSSKAAAGGNSGFVNDTLDSLFEDDNGKPLPQDPNTGQQILNSRNASIAQDILTTIGNNPEKDFGDNLDTLSKATKKYIRAQKLNKDGKHSKEEIHAKHALVDAIRGAGGEVNAFAKLEGQPELLFQFITEIFECGPEQAVNNFSNALGLSGEQAANFQEALGFVANVTHFAGKDFVPLIPSMKSGFQNATQIAKSLSGQNSVEIETTSNDKPTSDAKNASLNGGIDPEHKEVAKADAAKGAPLTGNEVKVTSFDDKSVLTKGAYKTASLGIVNKGPEADAMEADMSQKIDNNNMSLSMTG